MIAVSRIPPTVRALTWLDFAVCAVLSLPFAAALLFGLLDLASTAMGGASVQPPTGAGAFFVNLAGLFGVLWNVVMLTNTQSNLHRIDLVARLGVIALIVFHIALSGLSLVFALFVLTEVVGGIAKFVWLTGSKDQAAP